MAAPTDAAAAAADSTADADEDDEVDCVEVSDYCDSAAGADNVPDTYSKRPVSSLALRIHSFPYSNQLVELSINRSIDRLYNENVMHRTRVSE